MTSQTFNLDLIPQGVPPIIHVSQYDKGQTWEIHLYENGIVFPVPANTSAAIQGTKPDSTGFQFPAVISAGDNVVMFTLEQQMTVFSGDIDCELVLVNGDDQVATINFILSVEPTTLDDDTVISETQLPLIEQAAELGAVINNYATQIHADAETASTAATSASADATTATAAADDATASKTAAATSASNAATSETNAAASATAAASSESNAATSETNAAASASSADNAAQSAAASATAAQAAMSDKLSIYTADATQWDSTPTANSTKPVTSGGIKAQFDAINTNVTQLASDVSELAKNTFGTAVDVSGYNFSNRYLTQHDGYFEIMRDGQNAGILTGNVRDSNNGVMSFTAINPSTYTVRAVMYVKKGMGIYANGLANGDSAKFVPLA